MASDQWTEVHRVSWDSPRRGLHGCPDGRDYFTAIYERMTWPEDGSKYAGITYERRTIWIGNAPGICNVVHRSDEYPAERSPLNR